MIFLNPCVISWFLAVRDLKTGSSNKPSVKPGLVKQVALGKIEYLVVRFFV